MRVTTFGEIMLRLTVPDNKKLIQTDTFQANYGGAEANVAVSLALLGDSVNFVTKLPENELGDAVIQKLKSFGVDTSEISRGGNRLGIYFSNQESGIGPARSFMIVAKVPLLLQTIQIIPGNNY